MKSTQRVMRLTFLLALVAALLIACVAPAATTDSAPADDAMAAESAESEGPKNGRSRNRLCLLRSQEL